MTWKVLFFQTARGDYPVAKFAREQDSITRAKIVSSIELLKNHGPLLKPPYIKKIQNKLYELRISGKIAVRIFYTIYNGEFYLLHAFKKKTEKTPKYELEVALDRLRNYV
jgi:phage-related protein